MKPLIFISYARTDSQHAVKLEQDLRARGFETWRDERNLDPNQDFTGEIEAAIKAASHMVVCLTPDVKNRKDSYVRREIVYALGQDKARRAEATPRRLPLIPIVFSGGELPLPISTWTAFFAQSDSQYDSCIPQLISRLNAPPGPPEEADYSDSPALVAYLNALHEWTSTRLQKSVHELINLSAKNTPDAVAKSAGPTLMFNFESFTTSPLLMGETKEVQTPIEETWSTEPLNFSSFKEAFKYHERRMLLLGAPGAGKTTTLLAFARDAAVARLNDPSEPVPILASIHTWDHKMAIPEWAQGQATGADFSGQGLLYILDGLDELGGERPIDLKKPDGDKYDPRAKFIEAFRTQMAHEPVVLTSRIIDYSEIGTKVALPGATTLQALTNEQIEGYLARRGQPQIWTALKKDEGLIEIARTPLLLALLTIAFQTDEGDIPVDLTDLNEHRIFDRYIHARFVHEMAKPEPLAFDEATTREWLSKLAADMFLYPWFNSIIAAQADIVSILGPNSAQFAIFAHQMHFLQLTASEDVQFIHLKLRDYCAIHGLLKQLMEGIYGIDRFWAASALGSIKDTSAVHGLLKALSEDCDGDVRQYAASALGQIKDVSAVHGLLKALSEDDDWNVRYHSAGALGKIKDSLAIHGLLKALSEDDNLYVCSAAAYALGKIKDSLAIHGLLKALSEDDNLYVCSAAAYALGKIKDSSAVPGLLKTLSEDYEGYVRSAAASALGEIKNTSAVSRLLKALSEDDDRNVRYAAASALGAIKDISAVHGLIDAVSEDDDQDVRFFAAHALEQIGTPEAISAFEEWRQRDRKDRDSLDS